MWSWKKRHSVCAECGVHFEPVPAHLARWGHLCAQHRAPVMDADRRKDRVTEWAADNFERLEKMMLAEKAERHEKDRAAFQQHAMMNQASNPMGWPGGLQSAAMDQFDNVFGRRPQ